jgi:GNAT superfamily N-acetyltransferase
MCRTLLLPLVVGGLALGLPFARGHLAERDGRAAANGGASEEHGVLAVGETSVHFTLYRPERHGRAERSLVIFAADAHAKHPRPLRLFAEASATAGVTAIYLEPSALPAEAAARLKRVLQHQAQALHLDAASVWTWVEGQGLGAPVQTPCTANRLAATAAWLRRDVASALVHRTLDWTLRAGCSVKSVL